MNQKWIKRMLAWLLAGMLTIAPALAEVSDDIAEAPAIESAVEELGEFDLAFDESDPPVSETPVSEEPVSEEPVSETPEPEETSEAFAPEEQTLALNAESLTLGIRETFALKADHAGARFTSSNDMIAPVDPATGLIEARKPGDVVITATWGSVTATCAVTVLKAPNKVTLSAKALTLGAGETCALTATIPEGTASRITWSSSNAAIATVDGDGLITARSMGTAKITAAACNGKKAVCKLTVTPVPTAIRFGTSAMTLSQGQTRAPEVTVEGGEPQYALTSADPAVVRVEGDRLIAVAPGETTVTARTYNGLEAAMTVTVTAAPKTMSLPVRAATLGVKETLTLKPAFDADVPADVTYTSSSPKVASVSESGVITAKKAGTAVITVATHNGLTAACTIRVMKAPKKISISDGSLTLGVGEIRALKAALTDGTASALRWSSGNPGVAAVDAAGRVTALAEGQATITVETFNGKRAACAVTVRPAPVAVGLFPAALTLSVGQKAAVRVELNGGSAGAVALDSSDAAVVTVAEGEAVAVAAGIANITAVTYNGLTAQIPVTVVPAPKNLWLDAQEVTLGIGDEYALAPRIDDDSRTDFTFTSAKPKIASVSAGGVVTAKKAGSVLVTVATHNGLTARVKINVVKVLQRMTLTPETLTLEQSEFYQLQVKMPAGADPVVQFASDNPTVAAVGADGLVTTGEPGNATITATASNGQTATCRVTVTELRSKPTVPSQVRLTAESATTLIVQWDRAEYAAGYRVYLNTVADAASATLYGEFSADTARVSLRGLTGGAAYHVYVTAYNKFGETSRGAASASAKMPVDLDGQRVNLNYSGMIMMACGATRTVIAVPRPSGYAGDIQWESTDEAAVSVMGDGATALITGKKPGKARVSAVLDNEMSASVTVMVVDTTDISDENFTAVQKAIADQESLLNVDVGGDVIWQMVSAKLTAENLLESRVKTIVEHLRKADPMYQCIYVFALGTYDIMGEAVKDKHGNLISVSYFSPSDNTLYLTRTSSANESYAYTALHESGHAVDYNADGNHSLNSQNNDAYEAVMSDVRNILRDRVGKAVEQAGVDAAQVDTEKVVAAVLNYRELLHHDEVMATLSAEEQQVYEALVEIVRNEINTTLPRNNGVMVWDAIEGVTNYAIKGKYGHAYLFDIDAYKEYAKYYYYDRQGNPLITSETWAEFFSANVMEDTETLEVNLRYLPNVCKYFAETFVPKVLNYFRNMVKSK